MAKFDPNAQNRALQKIYKRVGLRRDQNFGDTQGTFRLVNRESNNDYYYQISFL
tara:strand:- start:889 stop:1050 length:162 start_codon:yes stop_codon:yes gene_type:complete